jgi:hypothetical protein
MGMRGGAFFSRGRAARQLYQMELSVVVLSVSVILSSSSLLISLFVFRFIFQFLNTLRACHVYHVERIAS